MNRIQKARKLNKLTQAQLATALNVARTTVTMWETSSSCPDNETLVRLSKILHVPVDFLIGAGVFENWDDIMQNAESVFYAIKGKIPPNYSDPIKDDRYLIANLDIAFFYDKDELFLIQWFSNAVKSVVFDNQQNAEVEFTPIFESAIKLHNSNVLGYGDMINKKLYEFSAYEYANPKKNQAISIPVLGTVPAGIPIEAVEDIIDWEDIPESMTAGHKEYFALEVKGDSMWPDYLPGDVVIVRRQPTCDNGEDCVVYVNGYDATLKQVRLNAEDHSLTIVPRNQSYPPRTFTAEEIQSLPVTIAGVVVELRRKIKK